MMRKKFFRAGAILVLCLMVLFANATSAFAYYNEDEANEDEDNSWVVVDDPVEETETPAETEQPVQEPQGQITPDGNMTLVDDLDYSSRGGLQFMTVTTKDGHVFYIVIDRTANSENVYFLNQVDAADLMALMNDEQKEAYQKEQDAREQAQQAPTPTQQPTQTPTETQQPQQQTDPERQPLNNNLVMVAVFGVIGIGVIAAYYFLKIKPKKTGSSIDEDREFFDDEEYENEDQEPAFAEDEEG